MAFEFPLTWQIKTLQNVVSKPISYGIVQTGESAEHGVFCVRVVDITNGKPDLSKMIKTSSEISQQYKRTILQLDDLMIALRGEIGKTAIVDKSLVGANLTRGLAIISPNKNEVYPQYLLYAIDSPYTKQNILRRVNGSALKEIPILALREVEVAIPPLPEQHKIADILSTWDEAIDLTEQLIAAKQKRKQALMQRLLTGQVRFSSFKQNQRCYVSRFGLIPEEWKVVELGAVVSPITRPTSVEPEQQYRLIGVRWYGEGAHIHDIVNGSNIQTSTLTQIREGDILYNKMWTTKGAFAIAKAEHDGAYGSTEYPQFVAQQDSLDIRFLEYIFHLPRFKRDAINLCRGTTGRARLNPQDFLTLEIPLPPLEEQKKIAELLNGCQEEINLLQQKLAALRQQKQGLMQQLLTGKIRVKV